MSKKLIQLCQSIKEIDPPARLAVFVLARIEREKLRRIKQNLILSYVGFVSSAIMAVYALVAFGHSFIQSEFWSMLSLAFSDITVVAQNRNEFGLSLMETFPIMHVFIILVPLLILLVSANAYLSNRFSYKHRRLAYQS